LVAYLLLVSTLLFTSLYTFHRGFRRTVQFWRGLSPIVVKYKWLKLKAHKIDKCDEQEYERRITVFRQKSAPQLVNLIISLGGIYVKIGQVMSTIGAGLLPEEYVQALRPLQDGVPAKDIKEISRIIESSSGKRMNDIFLEFEEKPIGDV
jgi:aarF domain-containing kinase